jgi:tRNA A-37 threonylcarbamoyl transferase component Bud32
VHRFDKEVDILKRLQGCACIPKLYWVDTASKTLYMEYVGRNVSLSQEQKLAVNKALRHLGERYHVFRVKDGKARFSYRDLFPANICVNETTGQVFLIDFGSNLWQVHSRSYQSYLKN